MEIVFQKTDPTEKQILSSVSGLSSERERLKVFQSNFSGTESALYGLVFLVLDMSEDFFEPMLCSWVDTVRKARTVLDVHEESQEEVGDFCQLIGVHLFVSV